MTRPPGHSTTLKASIHGRSPGGRLSLVVVGDGHFASYALPEGGAVTIGRVAPAEIRIDNPSVSREHARLRTGPPITIEDLGSSNGTRIRDRRLEPNEVAQVALDETFYLGPLMLVVQRQPAPLQTRRIWPHGYFEGRVEEECTRSEDTGATFAVLAIELGRAVPESILQQTLAHVLRPVDVLGQYGANDYEVLLSGVTAVEAEEFSKRLAARFAGQGAAINVGLACYPRDGKTVDLLIEVARHGGEPAPSSGEAVVVVDARMAQLYEMVAQVARSDITVLLLGETGVGKEVLAEAVHRRSPRNGKPFLKLNCAALSETLLESELFGHERGAFTGAIQAKPGLLESADGGTVFLDEIGDMPMSLQVKLLRVLEQKEVMRVGGLRTKSIDVRFVGATNRDLEADSEAGVFRRDLYFRLSGICLSIPPLRERQSEIEPLARTFIADAAARLGRPAPDLPAGVLDLLRAYSWPGNIRELRNVIERAVVLSTGTTIEAPHLPVDKMQSTFSITDSRDLVDSERERIEQALEACAGNQTQAAKMVGMPRRTFLRRLDEYGIARPRKSK